MDCPRRRAECRTARRRLRVDIDSQHLAEQAQRVLGVPCRVAGAAAVAEPDVKVIVVRTEGEIAAVVVRGGLLDGQQDALRARIQCLAPVEARELRSHRAQLCSNQLAVIEVDASVRREVRMKGEAKEARLAFPVHTIAQVDEHLDVRHRRVVRENKDAAVLLCHVPARGVVRQLLHGNRGSKAQVREGAWRLDAGAARRRLRIRGRRVAATVAATAGKQRGREPGGPEDVCASWLFPSLVHCNEDRSDGAKFLRRRLQGRIVLSKAEAHEPRHRRLVAEGRQWNRRDTVPAGQLLAESERQAGRRSPSNRPAGNMSHARVGA